jgi:ATP phosphoribosyltransferase regulatory subunit
VSASPVDARLQGIMQALAPRDDFTDLPILLPASMVLELAGESLRPRLFFVTGPDGSELCLRPDLTIPAVVHYIDTAETDNARQAIACKGPVFRAPREGENRPPEFVQIGLERFGDGDVIAADTAVFCAAWRACQAGTSKPLHVRFCDGGLMPHVLANADLDPVWHQALSEHTSHSRAFLAVLAQASGKIAPRALAVFDRDLVEMTLEDATQKVAQIIDRKQLSLTGARTAQDVARHLILRAQRALAPPLSATISNMLDALARFQHQGSRDASMRHVVDLGAKIGVDLTGWRDTWLSRFAAIEAEAPTALAQCRLDALGEEAFDYYDGMAFDIAVVQDFARPVATGGRYDRLVGELSLGSRQARAVGCVIRPDRFGELA